MLAAMKTSSLCILLFISGVAADGWDDFTNNLATDLAPLITLFGEALTKQFLSESIGLLDDILFALAPLGILTAVVSAIRIRGNSSLRAFIGRAQEGPGDAEQELLSCVSETTAELFNNGGISRIFGKPKILEVKVRRDSQDPSKMEITSIADALKEDLNRQGKQILDVQEVESFKVPNLSLNKGIKRQRGYWFAAAVATGCLLQTGVMVFSGLTVFAWPDHFPKNGSPVASYAFPLFIMGTTFVTAGMFWCAFLVERASNKYTLNLEKSAEIYWLQPGNQEVGDQVLEAFAAVSRPSRHQDFVYKKSVRDYNHLTQIEPLLGAVSTTIVGFIFQFIGLRGLHSSVTLAQLGATLAMSVIRASLRTQRMDKRDNLLLNQADSHDKRIELSSYDGYELEWLTSYLHNICSFQIMSGTNESQQHDFDGTKAVSGIIGTHLRLAKATSAEWDDRYIKFAAQNLAHTIEATMEYIAAWSKKAIVSHTFDIPVEFELINQTSRGREKIPLTLSYGSRWTTDAGPLEAIIGISVWLLKRQLGFSEGISFYRCLHKESSMTVEESRLLFSKWFPKHEDASLKLAHLREAGGYFYLDGPSIACNGLYNASLVVETQTSLELLVAQDIYIHFLASAFGTLDELGGKISVQKTVSNTFYACNDKLSALVDCFETRNLGTSQDAYLCLIPTLTRIKKLPRLRGNSKEVLGAVEHYLEVGDWQSGISLRLWQCGCSCGSDFEVSLLELAYLCCRGLTSSSSTSRQVALDCLEKVLTATQGPQYLSGLLTPHIHGLTELLPRSTWFNDFAHQLGWFSHQISMDQNDGHASTILESFFSKSSLLRGEENFYRDLSSCFRKIRQLDVRSPRPEVFNFDATDRQIVDLVLQNKKHAILYWLAKRYIEISPRSPNYAKQALIYSAEKRYSDFIEVLKGMGESLDSQLENGKTLLCTVVEQNDLVAVEELVQHGAHVDCRGLAGLAPLLIATLMDYPEIVEFLLQNNALVDQRDVEGKTALMLSVEHGNTKTAQVLLNHHADTELQDPNGNTALLLAVEVENIELTKLLIERKANLEVQNRDDWTALIIATRSWKRQLLQMLLDENVAVDKKSLDGRTALDFAKQIGWEEGIRLLQAAGARCG